MAAASRLGAALGAVVALLLWAPPATAAQERIASYGITAEVGADGTMRVAERIDYAFDAEPRRGIYRLLPLWSDLPDGTRWMHPTSIVSVTMDGQPVRFETQTEGPFLEVRIGDPDITITGSHVYEIVYDVAGVLRAITADELAESNPYGFSAGDAELYWDFIGTEWGVPIARAEILITGPGSVLAAQCFAGFYGDAGGCADRISGSAVTMRKSSLLPYEGISAVVAYPASAFASPPTRIIEATPITESPLRVGIVGVAVGLLLLALPPIVVLLLRRRLRGVDIPLAPVRFGPPGDLRPAEIAVSLDGELEPRAVVATLLDLVARRQITLAAPSGGTIELAWWGAGAPDQPLRPWEERLVNTIFEGRERATLGGYDADVATAVTQVESDLEVEAIRASRLAVAAQDSRRRVGCGASITFFIALGCLIGGAMLQSLPLLLGALPALAGLTAGLWIAAAVMPDRETVETARFEAEVEGFRRFLDTDPGAARRELAHRLGLPAHAVYATFLPYAVLFDLEESWSGAFPELTQEELNSAGLYLSSTMAIHRVMSSAASTVKSTYTAPSASGSSGFSGGGFSGGGGGGGGGGSW